MPPNPPKKSLEELVALGDILEIRPGESAPVDGELLAEEISSLTPKSPAGQNDFWGATAAACLGVACFLLF